MPITLDYTPEDGFVRAMVAGAVTMADFRAGLEHLVTSDVIPSTAPILYDMRAMDPGGLSFSEAVGLMGYRRGVDEKRGGTKVAFLVASDAAYGTVRLWQNLTQDEPGVTSTYQIFRDEGEAVAWLKP